MLISRKAESVICLSWLAAWIFRDAAPAMFGAPRSAEFVAVENVGHLVLLAATPPLVVLIIVRTYGVLTRLARRMFGHKPAPAPGTMVSTSAGATNGRDKDAHPAAAGDEARTRRG